MDTLLPLGTAIAGFVIGTLVFSRLGHWLVGIRSVFATRAQVFFSVRLAVAVFLAAGPWLLVALGTLGYNVHGQAWSYWLFGGVLVALSFFACLSFYFARKKATADR